MGSIFTPGQSDFGQTNAVVVGGGIVGTATAFWLSKAGLDVVLLEMRDGLSTLTTPASAECFRAQFAEPAMAALAIPSIEMFENFAEVIGIPGYHISIKQQGYLFLTDRLKDIVISSGYNIYPRILENALYRHPQVEEAVVIGISDKYKGEVPKAFVKLKSGASVTEEELLDFSASHLNPIERIAVIEFRNELPKTLVGKLSKKELIAEEVKGERTKSVITTGFISCPPLCLLLSLPPLDSTVL